jgi:SAM-dependent methyltransferase
MHNQENYIEIKNCLVCDSTEKTIIYKDIIHTCGILETLKINNVEKSNVYICNNCGHSFLSPVLKGEIITDYYTILNSEYFDKEPIHYRQKDDLKIFNRIYDIKSSGKVLEIGCGNGFLLNLFKGKGYECIGIEPSPKAANYAKEKLGLNVLNQLLDQNTFDESQFDVILLMDVIEHLYHPNELMQICNKILKKDGILVILTGDINAINAKLWQEKWYYFYSWEHISFFSKKSLLYLTKRNGFSLLSIRSVSHINGFLYNLYTLIIHNPLMYIYNFYIKKRYKHINLAFDHILLIVKK